MMHSSTFIALNEAVDIAMDNLEEVINDWGTVLKVVNQTHISVYKYERYLQNVPVLGKLFQKAAFLRIARVYDMLVNFIDSHQKA